MASNVKKFQSFGWLFYVFCKQGRKINQVIVYRLALNFLQTIHKLSKRGLKKTNLTLKNISS